MEIAGVIALLLFLAFMTLVTVATVRTVRSVKRGVARGGAQARRLVEDNRLRARRYTMPGPAGELARLRLELRAAVDSTFRALDDGSGDDASLAEAAVLMDRLNDHSRALDAEMRLLENEPDRARIADRMPDLVERTHRITHAADGLRWAAQDRARRFADDDLSALTREIGLEAGALRHWAPVESDSVRPAGPTGPGPGAGPMGPGRVGSGSADAGAVGPGSRGPRSQAPGSRAPRTDPQPVDVRKPVDVPEPVDVRKPPRERGRSAPGPELSP